MTFENIKFFISSNPDSPYDTAKNAMSFRWIKDLKLRNIEVNWEKPAYDKWESAISLEDIDGLQVDGFSGIAAWPERDVPAIALKNVQNATLRDMNAMQGNNVFLKVSGAQSRDIHLLENNFHDAKVSIPSGLTSGGRATERTLSPR